MMTTNTEPRVILAAADGLFHWRWRTHDAVCGDTVQGPLTTHTEAINRGAVECGNCDGALRRTGWRPSRQT